MQKCLNSSPWASRMIARASRSGSTASRCSYQPIASASSVSEAQSRAKVRVSGGQLVRRLVVLVGPHCGILPPHAAGRGPSVRRRSPAQGLAKMPTDLTPTARGIRRSHDQHRGRRRVRRTTSLRNRKSARPAGFEQFRYSLPIAHRISPTLAPWAWRRPVGAGGCRCRPVGEAAQPDAAFNAIEGRIFMQGSHRGARRGLVRLARAALLSSLFMVSLGAFAGTAGAATYYVDCSAGNDNASGKATGSGA